MPAGLIGLILEFVMAEKSIFTRHPEFVEGFHLDFT